MGARWFQRAGAVARAVLPQCCTVLVRPSIPQAARESLALPDRLLQPGFVGVGSIWSRTAKETHRVPLMLPLFSLLSRVAAGGKLPMIRDCYSLTAVSKSSRQAARLRRCRQDRRWQSSKGGMVPFHPNFAQDQGQ